VTKKQKFSDLIAKPGKRMLKIDLKIFVWDCSTPDWKLWNPEGPPLGGCVSLDL
jgi:hypothetical protein